MSYERRRVSECSEGTGERNGKTKAFRPELLYIHYVKYPKAQ